MLVDKADYLGPLVLILEADCRESKTKTNNRAILLQLFFP